MAAWFVYELPSRMRANEIEFGTIPLKRRLQRDHENAEKGQTVQLRSGTVHIIPVHNQLCTLRAH